MVETSAAEASGGAPGSADGLAMATAGTVSVAVGLVLAPTASVFAAVLVGVPGGLTAWLLAREVGVRTASWPLAAEGRGGDTAAAEGDVPPSTATVGAGSEQ